MADPYVFNYQPGMAQFWKAFQNRLQNPPPEWGGIRPGQTGLPPELLKFIMQSPFPMWKNLGLPFLGSQQQAGLSKYSIDSQKRNMLMQMIAAIGTGLAGMFTGGATSPALLGNLPSNLFSRQSIPYEQTGLQNIWGGGQ